MEFEGLYTALRSLVIFRGLGEDGVIKKLKELLRGGGDAGDQVERYAAFTEALYNAGGNLTEYMLGRALEDENIYVQKRAAGEDVCKTEECLEHELGLLGRVSQIKAEDVRARLEYSGYLPGWETGEADFISAYRQRMNELPERGYGIYSKHRMLCVKDGAVTPVLQPDTVRLSDLKGYERQRQAVVDNTLALLGGKPAANALLFGDAGTGKSSTVKAVVNEYWERGLRLVEIKKNQAGDIPVIMQALSQNPLKFILFIDDLSFAGESDGFYALKAVLEGSASAKAPNVAIYATSNRRHLIKESFADRQGDDVHRDETIQETISLSARFGLTVAFLRPDKKLYLRIVGELARDAGLSVEQERLELEAERFAEGGRSPRAAKQFIEQMKRAEV
jgi:predicted AAA+ superfamily ATPase